MQVAASFWGRLFTCPLTIWYDRRMIEPVDGQAEVSIVVVSWNVAALLRRCLTSCYAQAVAVEVVVVDNASADGSPTLVSHEFPQAMLIANRDNRGFPAAVNQGIAATTAPYVLILNPDAALQPGSLALLLAHLRANPQLGMVGPRLRYPNGTAQSSRRRFPTFTTLLIESTPLQPLFARSGLLRHFYCADQADEVAQEVDWLTGACLLLRREAIQQVGGLDEGFFMYSEEVDWARRLKQAGWAVAYLPTTEVVHAEGQSSGQATARRQINFNVSKVRYVAKWQGVSRARWLRRWLLLLESEQTALEAAKWLLGHKRLLRAARLRAGLQVLANGYRHYLRPAASPNLALLSAEYPPQPGGVGDYTRKLAGELAVPVITAGAGGRLVVRQPLGLEPADRAAGAPLAAAYGWGMLGQVHRLLLREKIDALNIEYQTGAYAMHPAINLLPLYLKLRGNPARTVTTFHDLLPPYLFPKAGRLRWLANWLLLKFSDVAIVTNAQDAAQVGGWGAKVRVIPIGSNIAARRVTADERRGWRLAHRIAEGDTLLVYFGLLNQSKGLDTILHALAQLPASYRLAIVGGGIGESDATNRPFARYIEEQSKRLQLDQRIMRSGPLPEAAVSEWLQAGDLAALPFRDGASLRRGSLLACLAHGLPTVSTHPNPLPQGGMEGLPELVDGENVLLVEAGDAAGLAAAIQRLAGDGILRAKLAAGGRRLVASLGWEHIAAQVREVMQRLAT